MRSRAACAHCAQAALAVQVAMCTEVTVEMMKNADKNKVSKGSEHGV